MLAQLAIDVEIAVLNWLNFFKETHFLFNRRCFQVLRVTLGTNAINF